MCNIEKIESTFQHKGDKYRAHFSRIDDKIRPIIERKIVSIMGFNFWKTVDVCKGEKYQNIDISDLENDTPLIAVNKLRQFAQLSVSPRII